MSDQVLTLELTNLHNDSKKKFPEIRAATDVSLQTLKSIQVTSQQQLATRLLQHPAFVEPFILACATQNAKLISSAIICLQRLVAVQAVPNQRLKDVLHALNQCASLSFDVQLKVLQVLPALAQNYGSELKRDLLTDALRVCAALQAVKAQTISGVATATFQQLVFALFERIVAEDRQSEESNSETVELQSASYQLYEAAFDGYHVFSDLALAVDDEHPRTSSPLADLTPTLALDTIYSCLNTYDPVFASHPELVQVLKATLLPFLIRVLSERRSFALTVRSLRLVTLVVQKHLRALPQECEIVLGLLTYCLEPDAAPVWKRVLCLEVFRALYATPDLAVQIYTQYDQHETTKSIIKDNISSFVRLSSENPAAIGAGQQSAMPDLESPATAAKEQQAVEAAGGVVGVISSALAVSDAESVGISMQRSVPKVACIDSLDKTDPPGLPETYSYSLVIDCLSHLADMIAKDILARAVGPETDAVVDATTENGKPQTPKKRRTKASHRARSLPVNPLQPDCQEGVNAIASLIEECWPAILATTSTFLHAALDNDFYHQLVRSLQRFSQIAGLLEKSTARDAFLTTLSKAAVPANLLNPTPGIGPTSPSSTRKFSSSFYRSPKALLSVDSIASSLSNDKHRRSSADQPRQAMLGVRNLLCLRALLNLATAVGPLLGPAIEIVLTTLRQADNIVSSMLAASATTPEVMAEVEAVTVASKRLFELTTEYSDDAFRLILQVICRPLQPVPEDSPPSSPASSNGPRLKLARLPSSYGVGLTLGLRDHDRISTLGKLKQLAGFNIDRFASVNALQTGWSVLSHALVHTATSADESSSIRTSAADIICRTAVSIATVTTTHRKTETEQVQGLSLIALEGMIKSLRAAEEPQAIDHEVHAKAIEALRDILEACNTTLQTGWTTVLGSLETVFVFGAEIQDRRKRPPQLLTPSLGRLAFETVQLICSDFLGLIPMASLAKLVDILHHFASQDNDLNMSLTTITLFHDVSNHVATKDTASGLHVLAASAGDLLSSTAPLIDDAAAAFSPWLPMQQSKPAQWFTILHKLSKLMSDERAEIRHGACQTLVRIVSIQAATLSNRTWVLIVKYLYSPMVRINLAAASSDQQLSRSVEDNTRYTTIKLLIEAIAKSLSNHMPRLQGDETFSLIWEDMIRLTSQCLDLQSHVVTAAVFLALTEMLRALDTVSDSGKAAAQATRVMLCDCFDTVLSQKYGKGQEQSAKEAYLSCTLEVHRVCGPDMTPEELSTMMDNAYRCMTESKEAQYGGDVKVMTPLQSSGMQLLRSVRHERTTIPELARVASDLVKASLPLDNSPNRKRGISLIAISKDAIVFAIDLIRRNKTEFDPSSHDGLSLVMRGLYLQASYKYRSSFDGRHTDIWRPAVTAALDILDMTFNMIRPTATSQSRPQVWASIIDTAGAIMGASLGSLDLPDSFDEVVMVEQDEDFDCQALARFQSIVGISIGHPRICDEYGAVYLSSLCRESLIHETAGDRGVPTSPADVLQGLFDVRAGRVTDLEASRREDLAYQCFEELIRLVSVDSTSHGNTHGAPTPEHLSYDDTDMTAADCRARLARDAAPYLLLRLTYPIKAYLADQPLRGSCPTPVSKVEELLWTLEQMATLRCQDAVLGDGHILFGTGRPQRMSGRAAIVHIEVLYPLLVRLSQVAGHAWYGDEVIFSAVTRVLSVAADM